MVFHVYTFFNNDKLNSREWLKYLKKKTPQCRDKKDLVRFTCLDKWYQKFDMKKNCKITNNELIKIVDWKLTRGKMRPLMWRIKKLTNTEVETATRLGCIELKNKISNKTVINAINTIVKPLSGVGPATASAILATYDKSIPFMSDAGLMAVTGELIYTIPSYIKYFEGITNKVNELNTNSISHKWTAHDVEEVLHLIYSTKDL